MKTEVILSVPTVYEDRWRTLNNQCKHSHKPLFDMESSTSDGLIAAYPSLKTALFPFPIESFMYCAIPKVASKTLISVMLYVYVRDIINDFKNKRINLDINSNRTEQLINIPELIRQLRKNGITISNIEETNSIIPLLETYLHLLQFESINQTSPSVFFNPWRQSFERVFSHIQFKSLLNISQIFSSSFTRFLFVRHPFERIASAYKERIAILPKDRIQPEPYYDSIRRTICYRYALVHTIQQSVQKRKLCEDFIPSFEHFIQYILANTETPTGIARMDNHWKPYTMICQVCEFKYNFIGKYETFNDDFNFLLKRLNISGWNNQKRRGASGHTTWHYQQVFSSLSDDLICPLKRIYRDDFLLFNYRVEDYVNRTRLTCQL